MTRPPPPHNHRTEAEERAGRESYRRVGKILPKKQGRYGRVRQFKRARSCRRKLRTIPGGMIRDIERKSGEPLAPSV